MIPRAATAEYPNLSDVKQQKCICKVLLMCACLCECMWVSMEAKNTSSDLWGLEMGICELSNEERIKREEEQI